MASMSSTIGSTRRQLCLCLLAIAVAVLAAHGATLSFGYIWEDRNTFLDPSPLQQLRNLPGLFFASAHQGFSVSHTTPYYRPFTFISWGLEYAAFGAVPFWNHLMNLLIHAATAVSLFCIGRRLVPTHLLPALAAAVIFAVHPANAESIAYVAGRADILCGLFMGWSFWAYLRFRQEGQRAFLLFSQLLLVGALLSKEMALMLPPIVLLYELAVARRKNLLFVLIPTAITLAYLLVRARILTVQTWTDTPLVERLYTGIYVIGHYLCLLFFPVDIKTFYDVTTKFSLRQPEVLLMLTVIGGYLLVAALLFARQKRLLALLLLAVPVLLFPASNIPAMIIPSPMAARYLYVPTMGFCLAAGLALYHLQTTLAARRRTSPGPVGTYLPLGVVGIGLALLTLTTNGKWRNDETFFTTMLREAPNQPLSYKLAGNYLGKTSRGAEMARLKFEAYEVTKQRQLALAEELLKYGQPERAAHELRRIMNAENDPRITRLLTTIQNQPGERP